MFEEAQHSQLSEDPLTGDQILEDIGHLLQRHLAAVPWIRNGPARDRVQLCHRPGLSMSIIVKPPLVYRKYQENNSEKMAATLHTLLTGLFPSVTVR